MDISLPTWQFGAYKIVFCSLAVHLRAHRLSWKPQGALILAKGIKDVLQMAFRHLALLLARPRAFAPGTSFAIHCKPAAVAQRGKVCRMPFFRSHLSLLRSRHQQLVDKARV